MTNSRRSSRSNFQLLEHFSVTLKKPHLVDKSLIFNI